MTTTTDEPVWVKAMVGYWGRDTDCKDLSELHLSVQWVDESGFHYMRFPLTEDGFRVLQASVAWLDKAHVAGAIGTRLEAARPKPVEEVAA